MGEDENVYQEMVDPEDVAREREARRLQARRAACVAGSGFSGAAGQRNDCMEQIQREQEMIELRRMRQEEIEVEQGRVDLERERLRAEQERSEVRAEQIRLLQLENAVLERMKVTIRSYGSACFSYADAMWKVQSLSGHFTIVSGWQGSDWGPPIQVATVDLDIVSFVGCP